ncbi:hypothetical protein MICA_80 [Micavibrio aeruginosavorus ARL-13]|uniref:Uncharacterized protein n=1 Tax=Micavibrio aeruginosavorus (strain ARL-13) TaxID=856793 RepID=G2KMP1_MICAA|nr:hypothetical protein MICA_80 [Micavibrio aeruginosavorus ARL-13]
MRSGLVDESVGVIFFNYDLVNERPATIGGRLRNAESI